MFPSRTSRGTYVVLPTDLAKSDRVDILVEDEGKGDEKAEDGVTLGAEGVGENLESVGDNQGCECNVVRGIEQEDEGDDGVGGGCAPGDGVTGGADSLEGEKEQHPSARTEEENPSPDAFDERGGGDGPRQIPNLEDTVDEELCSRTGDANGLEHFVEIVGDETVSGPLRKPSESDNDCQTLTVTGGLDQGHPTNGGSDSLVEIDGGFDFLELVLDEWIPFIAVGVVVS